MDQASDLTKIRNVKRRGVTGKLATVRDLTAMLNVSRQTALTISQRWDFPTPFDVLGDDTGRPMAVWLRKDMERWVAENPDAVKPSKG